MAIKRKEWKPKSAVKEIGKRSVIILVLFSLVIMTVLGYSLAEMRSTSVKTTMNYVQNLTRQLTQMIDLEISSGRLQLTSIGDSLEQIADKKENEALEEFVTRKQALCGFDFIALEDTKNGRTAIAGTFPDNYTAAIESLQEMDTSQRALESRGCEVGIEDENVIYAMPLYEKEEQIGFLWAGNTAESMQSIIRSRSFQGQTYSCIINKNGDLILSADQQEEFRNLESIFKNGNDMKLREDMKEMKENIETDQSGIFSFITEGEHKVYLAYAPMEGGSWVMLTIIPTDLLSSEYDSFVRLAAVAVAGTLLVFLGFLTLLMRSYRSNRLKLERLAYTDEITGGWNNQAFCMKYREMCQMTDIKEYAIVLMDVVNFKEINKKFGVEHGDAMLRYLHSVISSCLDKEKGEFAARSEMDRFFLCLKEREPESVQKRLDDIAELANSFQGAGRHLPHYQLYFRMAACFAEDRETDPIALEDRVRFVLKMADAAPGKCTFYSKSFEDRVRREQEMNEAFEAALASEDFQVYFQPKVSLKDGHIEGAEALVRWHHPKRGLVPPGEFIPMLEGNGKIIQLDRYVFKKVCIWIQDRKRNGDPLLMVSVNLSRSHLLDEDFLAWFVETADKYQVEHKLIEFELTESTFMVQEQIEMMRNYIRRMHDLGFSTSIDDFGTGYSSISLLREFGVDVLKLDRSFFLDLDDYKARDVISCLVELAKKLNIRIVAEGIETKKQIEYLKELGCDVVQGYFFSRPLPEKEFTEWCRGFDFQKYEV